MILPVRSLAKAACLLALACCPIEVFADSAPARVTCARSWRSRHDDQAGH